MRDRMERFVLLPFTMGCVSESSIGVGSPHCSRSKESTPTRILQEEEEGEGEEEEEECDEEYEQSLSGENLKGQQGLLALPRVQKLFKNLKSFSHLFVYKDEMDEPEMEMEIGFPTDVKHVTHIGIDGSATSILSKGWDNQKIPESFKIPPLPVMPVEFGMPATRNSLNLHGST